MLDGGGTWMPYHKSKENEKKKEKEKENKERKKLKKASTYNFRNTPKSNPINSVLNGVRQVILDSPFCFTAIMQKLWPGIGRMRE